MTNEQLAAFIHAQSVMALAKIQGMVASNEYQKMRGWEPAYGEEAFVEVRDNLEDMLQKMHLDEPSPPTAASTQSEYGFPTKRGGTWYLSTRKLEEYLDVYANSVDVPAELKHARQWLRENTTRRKTPRGMTTFLTNWLNRAADRSGNGRPPSEEPPPDGTPVPGKERTHVFMNGRPETIGFYKCELELQKRGPAKQK